MATNWDAKHDPEGLVDYGELPRTISGGYNSRGQEEHEFKGSNYEDPFAANNKRYSYLEGSHLAEPDERGLSDSFPGHAYDVRDTIHKQHPSDDFSSKGSLVKNAAELSGPDLYSNHNKPPVEQMGLLLVVHIHLST
jgi:hypothetical protein